MILWNYEKTRRRRIGMEFIKKNLVLFELGSSVFMILGCFLPFITIRAGDLSQSIQFLSGLSNGILVLVLAIAVLVLFLFQKPVIAFILSIIILITTLYSGISTFQFYQSASNLSVSFSFGFFFLIAGCILTFVSFVAALDRNR